MAEVYFYHLVSRTLDTALPVLVEKSLERGWRVVIESCDEKRVAAIDDLLWTYDPASFLPHGRDGEADLDAEPVVITAGAGNPNTAQVRFLVDGAAFPAEATSYERVVLMFDGRDEDALAAARQQWKALRAAGHSLTYMQQAETGGWERKATTAPITV